MVACSWPSIGVSSRSPEYLKESREYGRDVAAATLLTTVLGEDAFTALARSKALTNEQMEWIINKVLDLGLGREKKGKAK